MAGISWRGCKWGTTPFAWRGISAPCGKSWAALRLSGPDLAGLNQTLREVLRESTLRRFDTATGPDGKKWKKSIRAATEGGQTLVNTADLKNSIHAIATSDMAAVGTNKVYARTHQFGDERTIRSDGKRPWPSRSAASGSAKKASESRFPARPYLGVDDGDMAEIRATVAEFIKDR